MAAAADQRQTLTTLQRALLAIEDAEARLLAKDRAAREPIAVIGLGCRVPGGGSDATSFWKLLEDEIDAISPVPPERWDHAALYDPDPGKPGHIAARSGGFLSSVDLFDPGFFNIAPREAEGMDPQQRLLLEVSWEALENAGQAPDRLQDTATGVYVGVGASDYAYLQLKSGDTSLLDAHFTSGIAHSVFSGRLSYLLGLRGPSLTIDTACSSSLVAVHLACQGLRTGECRMALAGGVNLILAPDLFIALSQARMLSPDGRCRTFDASANGFARAEGCGVVVLKRLSDAAADGDRVLAVIRASAVNQDGPSSSLTAPNGPAQEAVIRQALAFAGLAPRQIGFIEAHGTGTELGDPLEVKALGAVFGADRDGATPLIIGSVKTNLGHLEAAAGVTGLIKLIISLQHRTIPAHLHYRTPSPHIAWSDLPLQVPQHAMPWPPIDGLRVGGVSSFGFSGTNAHVIVEEAPPVTPDHDIAPGHTCLLAISARSPKALTELAARYAASITKLPQETALAAICHTANAGRAHFPHRATILAATREELQSGLEALARGETHKDLATSHVLTRDPPRIAFLFTGQGSQYGNMARGLYENSAVFRAALDRCAEGLAPYLDRPLDEILFGARASALIDQTAYTQPALFALGYALSELWRAWGVTPSVVLGHSVGEYAAACVAGVFSLEDALKLIALRGRLMQSLPAEGAMAAVFAPEDVVAGMVVPYVSRVSIAAVNGASQTVISGDAADVEAICEALRARGIKCRTLPVSHAFHSPLMEPILAPFEQVAGDTRFAAPRIRLISNLTGRVATAGEITQPAYWRRHAREPVRFGDGLRTLAEARPDICIELGPGATLLSLAAIALETRQPVCIASLRPTRPDWEQMLQGLSAAYLAGVEIDWRRLAEPEAQHIIDLPTYPFQREPCWFRARTGHALVATPRDGEHPLLGARQRAATASVIFQSRISADSPNYVRQHRVLNHVLLPATAYLEAFIAAARIRLLTESVCIEDVAIGEAMLLDDDGAARIVQTVWEPEQDGTAAIAISSVGETAPEAAPWTRHATAHVRPADGVTAGSDSLALARARCASSVDPVRLYQDFAALGVEFGGDFQSIRQAWRGEAEAVAHVAIDVGHIDTTAPYSIHPILLDGCLQIVAAALPERDGPAPLYLPVGVGICTVYRRAGGSVWGHVAVHAVTEQACRADMRVFDDDGTLLAELRDLQFKRVTREALERIGERRLDDLLYQLAWRPTLPAGVQRDVAPGERTWLLFADRSGMAAGLAARLAERGDRCILVEAGRCASQPGRASVDLMDPTAYRELIAAPPGADRGLHGVVYAWGLDAVEADPTADARSAQCQALCATAPTLLAQALIGESAPPPLWIVTRGGQYANANEQTVAPWQAAVWGLGRTLAIEHPELSCTCIDLDPVSGDAELDALAGVLADVPRNHQIALRAGEVLVPRLARLDLAEPVLADRALDPLTRLVPAEHGTFDRFVSQPTERRLPAVDEVEIAVEATGLNFKDVLHALGMLSSEPVPLGGECAGRVLRVGAGVSHVKPGDRVMAVAPDCFATSVIARAALVQRCPDEMSFEEAAAFPIAFITAAYCLLHTAGLRKGDRILIHAAAGGVGMAAVQIAQRAGAEVFATAGSAWKRDLLRTLGVRHVYDSRTNEFAAAILAETSGRGVDVVLNSLTGERLDASFSALASGGTFVEIGKRHVKSPNWVSGLGRNLRYCIVDWSDAAMTEPAFVGGLMQRLVEQLGRGELTPLPRQVFPRDETPRAFRLLAQARHVGKVVVRHGRATPPAIRAHGSYLITGGMSGLGLLVARWLAARGAGRLILIGRRGMTPEAEAALDELRGGGTQVLTEAVDVTDEPGLLRVLARIRADGPPLRGVVHCAAVLDDAALPQQTSERIANVFAPKVIGALLLDKLTRADPLDLFILFSSMASVFGSRGQANYAAANAVLDLLAEDRRRRGLCALSINWGAWAEVGVAAERGLPERLAASGLGAMTPAQGILVLERLLQADAAQVIAAPMDWQRFNEQMGPGWTQELLADILASVGDVSRPSEQHAGPVPGLPAEFASAASPRRRQLVATFVRDTTLRTLGIDALKQVEPATPLTELGLDSLLAVELRNTLGTALAKKLPVSLLFDYPTINALITYLLDEVMVAELAGPGETVGGPATAQSDRDTDPLGLIEELTDEDVDRLLSARERVSV